jgi:hypothetical protein
VLPSTLNKAPVTLSWQPVAKGVLCNKGQSNQGLEGSAWQRSRPLVGGVAEVRNGTLQRKFPTLITQIQKKNILNSGQRRVSPTSRILSDSIRRRGCCNNHYSSVMTDRASPDELDTLSEVSVKPFAARIGLQPIALT